jgi:hypothetical protein
MDRDDEERIDFGVNSGINLGIDSKSILGLFSHEWFIHTTGALVHA